MIPDAARSFSDPPGFKNSALPKIWQPVSFDSDSIFIRGVCPTDSKRVPAFTKTSPVKNLILPQSS
jgi:hypothetical protein